MKFTDVQIVNAIKENDASENDALRFLYKTHFGAVLHNVIQNNGDNDDAHDVFQEGIIIFHKNVVQEKFKGESAVGTYLYSICRFVWLKKLKKKGKEIKWTNDNRNMESYEDPYHQFAEEEQSQLINELFNQLGAACKSILMMAYYEKRTMAEIALLTGFKDEQNARNKKFKCMNALKELIASNTTLSTVLKM